MINSAAAIVVAILAAATVASASEKPTNTGDTIGSVTMMSDRTLEMHLSSYQCGGSVAEGSFWVKPGALNYRMIVRHVGGLAPNETKPIPAWSTPPCPNLH